MPQSKKPYPKVEHEYPTTTDPNDLKIVAKAVYVDLTVCHVCGELGLKWNNDTRYVIHEAGCLWPHNIKWAHDNVGQCAVIWHKDGYWKTLPEPEPACKCTLSAGGCTCGEFEKEYEKLHGKKALNQLNTLRGKH